MDALKSYQGENVPLYTRAMLLSAYMTPFAVIDYIWFIFLSCIPGNLMAISILSFDISA
jgi:hypothetical protein